MRTKLSITIYTIGLVGAFLMTSCSSNRAIVLRKQKLHSDALSIEPGWQVKNGILVSSAPYLATIAGASAGYGVGTVTGPITIQGEEYDRNAIAGAGTLVGAVFGYFIKLLFSVKEGKHANDKSKEEWLRKFNQTSKIKYTIVETVQDEKYYVIVPKKKIDQFWATEAEVNVLARDNDWQKINITKVEFLENQHVLRADESIVLRVHVKNDDRLVVKDILRANLIPSGYTDLLEIKDQKRIRGLKPGAEGYFDYRISSANNLKDGTTKLTFQLKNTKNKLIDEREVSLERASFFYADASFKSQVRSAKAKRRINLMKEIVFEGNRSKRSLEEFIAQEDVKAIFWNAYLNMNMLGLELPSYNNYVSRKACNSKIKLLKEKARSKDLEAIFLLSQAYYFGLGIEVDKELSRKFLDIAVQEGFELSYLDYAFSEVDRNEQEAIKYFNKAWESGDNRASIVFGNLYSQGGLVLKNKDVSKDWLRKGMNKKYFPAYRIFASYHLIGRFGQPDRAQAIKTLDEAIRLDDSWAMVRKALLILEDPGNYEYDYSSAITLLKKAAELNNSSAMYQLARYYLSDENGGSDMNLVKYWNTKSAILGNGDAALFMSYVYSTEVQKTGNEADAVLARFWNMEAYNQGVGKGREGEGHSLMNDFFDNFEVKKRYRTYEYYDGHTETIEYQDIGADLFSAGIDVFLKGRQASNDKLSGHVFAYETASTNTYAITLNDNELTSIKIREGQRFSVEGRGYIVAGSLASSVSADGTDMGLMANYNRVKGFKHAALLYRIGDNDPWKLAGKDLDEIAHKSGNIQFMVNDSEPANNKNYFDVKLTIEN